MFRLMTHRLRVATVAFVTAAVVLGFPAARGQSNLASRTPAGGMPSSLSLMLEMALGWLTHELPAAAPVVRLHPPQDPQPGSEAESVVDWVTRGPLHEAFAEAPQENPLPNPIVPRKPPEPIEEVPPEFKPAGEDVQWLPGYWDFDEERDGFLWISGIWRDIPPGRRWIPGFWEEVANGYRRVSGFWMDASVAEIEYLPTPPDDLENGPSMPAPSAEYFYAPGYWVFQSNRYAWRPGCWMLSLPEWVFVPPSYIWTPRGCIFRPGYWDRPFDCRGVVFAPVWYSQPVYCQPHYRFTPTCVIDTGIELLPHLFVRRHCRSYYFGDWYDDRYRDRGFCAWSDLDRHHPRGCQHDSMFHYYSRASIRHHEVQFMLWVRDRHDVCDRDQHRRPPRTFHAAHAGDHRADRHASDSREDSPVVIAETLERRVERTRTSTETRVRFERLNEEQRRTVQRETEPVLELARDRSRIERQGEVDRRNAQRGNAAEDTAAARSAKWNLPREERKQQAAAEHALAEAQRLEAQRARAAELAAEKEQRQQKIASQVEAARAAQAARQHERDTPRQTPQTERQRSSEQTGTARPVTETQRLEAQRRAPPNSLPKRSIASRRSPASWTPPERLRRPASTSETLLGKRRKPNARSMSNSAGSSPRGGWPKPNSKRPRMPPSVKLGDRRRNRIRGPPAMRSRSSRCRRTTPDGQPTAVGRRAGSRPGCRGSAPSRSGTPPA